MSIKTLNILKIVRWNLLLWLSDSVPGTKKKFPLQTVKWYFQPQKYVSNKWVHHIITWRGSLKAHFEESSGYPPNVCFSCFDSQTSSLLNNSFNGFDVFTVISLQSACQSDCDCYLKSHSLKWRATLFVERRSRERTSNSFSSDSWGLAAASQCVSPPLDATASVYLPETFPSCSLWCELPVCVCAACLWLAAGCGCENVTVLVFQVFSLWVSGGDMVGCGSHADVLNSKPSSCAAHPQLLILGEWTLTSLSFLDDQYSFLSWIKAGSKFNDSRFWLKSLCSLLFTFQLWSWSAT